MAIDPVGLGISAASLLASRLFPDRGLERVENRLEGIAERGLDVGKMVAPEVAAINTATNQATTEQNKMLSSSGLAGTSTGAAQPTATLQKKGQLIGGAYQRGRSESERAKTYANAALERIGMNTSAQGALGSLSGTALAGAFRGAGANSNDQNVGGADMTQEINRYTDNEYIKNPYLDLTSELQESAGLPFQTEGQLLPNQGLRVNKAMNRLYQ